MLEFLDFIQDSFAGRVREACYEVLEDESQEYDITDDWDDVCVPFAVMVWCDGLDYDDDGNAYFDDYPQFVAISYHTTQRGAEIELAYQLNNGLKDHEVCIEANYWTYEAELRWNPIRE